MPSTKKVTGKVLEVPGLLKKARGKMSQREYAEVKHINVDTLRNWEQGKNVPKLDAAIAFMKALGYEGLEELDIDLGGLMDILRGEMSSAKRECHHWIDMIFKGAPETVKEKAYEYLQTTGGKYGKR